ncbi:hypothetical protein Pla110_30040 [Polystyrenella longa]|uniref:3-keto-alpha-glucoside-1,2-lyase/3-keto-2-hydroxy-glucal hydratase domain-containing protein n=1 Tax=Polystyrenella longa TaxID=2528007 RepID=A0A518CPZ2_9PLAN|nr:DUF1080 domain-containing protein [Polystyrenella longa]QDU81264.1 hypothetical protein Pla110_30040 [Polystyrenella longa]
MIAVTPYCLSDLLLRPNRVHCMVCYIDRFVSVVTVGLSLGILCSLSGCEQPEPEPAMPPEAGVPIPAEEKLAEGVMIHFEPGFSPINLAGLDLFSSEPTPEKPTWREDRGVIICTGKPKGYAQTSTSYDNFILKYDYRFEPSERHRKEGKLDYSNTGVLVYISGEDQIWPKSIEVQGKQMEMASIKSNGGIPDVEIEDNAEKRETARKPVGDWNSIEVESKEGVLTTRLNGEQICQNKPGEVKSGRIGFQAEGFEVHFRNIRIKETE